ncbi:MAG: hypothetical protein ACOC32_01260 [Nanoarchaeota archaeon]
MVRGETFINVNITERAHQNVTFAADFDLVEDTVYALVQGWINISNPSAEPVYDVMVKLQNLSNLNTNVTWYSGRNGSQTVPLDLTDDSYVIDDPITRTPQPLPAPLDPDHDNMTDFMWINQTHLILDLSSMDELLGFEFPPGETADLDPHSVNFNNEPIIDSDGRTIGYVDGSFDFNAAWQIDGGTITIIEAANADYVVVHVPELRPGDHTVFTYNATPSIDPPLNLDTDYIHPQRTKVLADECFNVSQNATNEFDQGLNLTNVNITMEMQNVSWNGSAWNFTFEHLFPQGDYLNVVNESNHTWFWGVNGGNMTLGQTYEINFTVCAPPSVPNSSTYLYLKERLEYQTNGTVTGINVDYVRGRADTIFNFTKRIDRPADTDENRNVIWESEPSIGTTTNVTFNVTKISMWVSNSMDPNDMTQLKKRYFPKQKINRTQRWNSFEVLGDRWEFNFTDGSHPTEAPPPIIWMMPYYHIADLDDQIIRIFETQNGDDFYFKYIYVVNGYWLEIQKNVTSIAEDQYNVSLFVWNKGPGFTPRDLTVTIYDFVPEEFVAYNFMPATTASSPVSGAFNGTAYTWDVPPTRTVQNSSFAPKGDLNSTWNSTYLVNGTGDYRVSELYIVGLDPRLVDGGSSSETISVLSSMASQSSEAVYVFIVFALVAVNALNYVLTRRKE